MEAVRCQPLRKERRVLRPSMASPKSGLPEAMYAAKAATFAAAMTTLIMFRPGRFSGREFSSPCASVSEQAKVYHM